MVSSHLGVLNVVKFSLILRPALFQSHLSTLLTRKSFNSIKVEQKADFNILALKIYDKSKRFIAVTPRVKQETSFSIIFFLQLKR